MKPSQTIACLVTFGVFVIGSMTYKARLDTAAAEQEYQQERALQAQRAADRSHEKLMEAYSVVVDSPSSPVSCFGSATGSSYSTTCY
jgi:hypothetical protein